MITRTILFAAALWPMLLIGACGGTENRGLESVHQPVVSRTDYVFDVATSGSTLAPGEAQRLAGWMASLRPGYGDRVSVDDPSSYGPGIRDDVSAQLARYGLLLSNDVPVTGAPLAPGTARIVVSRMVASVPTCPDYSRIGQTQFDNHTSSNHGCSINSNLAAMVASPEDLVRGRIGSGLTGAVAASKAGGPAPTAATAAPATQASAGAPASVGSN